MWVIGSFWQCYEWRIIVVAWQTRHCLTRTWRTSTAAEGSRADMTLCLCCQSSFHLNACLSLWMLCPERRRRCDPECCVRECLLLCVWAWIVCREEEAGSLNVVAVSCTMYVRWARKCRASPCSVLMNCWRSQSESLHSRAEKLSITEMFL